MRCSTVHCRAARLCVLGFALVAVALTTNVPAAEVARPEGVGMSPERLQRLSGELQEYVDGGRLAGAVALVARRGQVVFHEAFGYRDAEAGARMQEDTIFRIASQSKAIVSVATLLLQEEGRLLISDPVGKYLPGFMETTVADYAAFLQMLLNGGELQGHRILNRKSVELMTTSHLGQVAFAPGQGFGLGFYIVEDVGARGLPGSAGEFGWGGAYHTSYWVDAAEDLVVVYMTQLIPAGDLDDHEKVRALVYQAIVD